MSRFRYLQTAAVLLVVGLFSWAPADSPAPENGPKTLHAANNLVYEIFIRSFCDGDGDKPNHVGDLKGILSKLDTYLNDGDPKTGHDLEVGILWLMPVFPTRTYHGYDVIDYRDVNPDYGTLDDFKTLLKEAHKRGVRIVLDLPINHTSDKHPWFQEAVKDSKSPFRAFYHIRPDGSDVPDGWRRVVAPNGDTLRYLGLFDSSMPDLNFENKEVWKAVKDVAKFWLDLGVDGFRLDAAKHIFGDRFQGLKENEILRNNDFWLDFSQFCYGINPQAVLFGEVLGDREINRRHAWGLDGLVSEAFMDELRQQVAWPAPGFLGRHKNYLRETRDLNREAFNPKLGFPDQPFQSFDYLASHDRNPRLASQLEEQRGRGMRASVDEAYRMALHALFTVSARPMLYQGDEVMQRGWKWRGNSPDHRNEPGDGSGVFDETLREPFPWYKSGKGPGVTKWFSPRFSKPGDGASKEEQETEGGMLHLVNGLSRLRTGHPALANGEIGSILSDSHDWMVCEKVDGKDRYLVLMNLTGIGSDYQFHKAWYPRYIGAQLVFWSDGKGRRWRDTTNEGKNIASSVFVPPFGLVVLREQSKNP